MYSILTHTLKKQRSNLPIIKTLLKNGTKIGECCCIPYKIKCSHYLGRLTGIALN